MTDLAAALLRDVPTRYHFLDDPRTFLSHDEVLAALSRALDPALVERAGEFCDEMLKDNQPLPSLNRIGKDRREAGRLIYNLLAQIAALRAERDALAAGDAEATRLMLGAQKRMRKYKARAEAAEAEVKKLRDDLQHARSEAKEAATLVKWCRDAFAGNLTEAELYQLQRVWEFADCAARAAITEATQ